MATSADDVLGALRGEAAVDSSGSFTLDQARAQATLQRFQLPSADHFLLPLVICAVTGKADSFSYFQHHRQRVVEISGLALGSEPLLELALLTAARKGGVKGASWNGCSGTFFQGASTQPLQDAPWERALVKTRLLFTLPGQTLLKVLRWVAGVGQARDPVAEVLKSYASYSPIPIRLNGRQINLERQGHWKHLTILNRPPLHLRPITSMRQVNLDQALPFAGYLGTGVGGGGVLVIVDGLLYPLDLPEAPEDFRAILWHSGLERDLSLLKLRENEKLHLFRRQLLELGRASCGPARPR